MALISFDKIDPSDPVQYRIWREVITDRHRLNAARERAEQKRQEVDSSLWTGRNDDIKLSSQH